MTPHERKFYDLIADNPGMPASSLPRKHRGTTLKTLELNGYIHYGPGGWYVVEGKTP